MARTNYPGYLRQYGSSTQKATPAPLVCTLSITVPITGTDPQGTGVILPGGARTVSTHIIAGENLVGTTPRFSLGSQQAPTFFYNDQLLTVWV